MDAQGNGKMRSMIVAGQLGLAGTTLLAGLSACLGAPGNPVEIERGVPAMAISFSNAAARLRDTRGAPFGFTCQHPLTA